MARIGSLVSLIVLLAVVAGMGYIGYQVYLWSNELAERGRRKLEKKNMSFTADGGLRVNVKEVSTEKYADKTQNVLVNTWNNASFPNYKSRVGWNSTQDNSHKSKLSPSPSPRPASSRNDSDSSRHSVSRDGNPALRPPEHRSSARRSASPLPGGWD